MPPDISFPNLGISFRNVPTYFIGNDPNASLIYFSGFPVNIYLYAVSIVVAISLAALLGFWSAKVSGQKVDDYVDLLLVGVVLAFIGLRVYYVVFNWADFRGQGFFNIFFLGIRDGGLAIYGGIIGAAVAAAIMGARKNIPFSVMADTGAPSMLLGQAIGRWGNFFNREAFGGFSDGLLAMQIRYDQARLDAQRLRELYDTAVVYVSGERYLQVHPTFLYESVLNFAYMIALLIYRPRKRFDGEIVLLYFLGYGIIRFIIEGLRTDQMTLGGTGIPLNQVTAVLFIVVSLILLIMGYRQPRIKLFRNRRK